MVIWAESCLLDGSQLSTVNRLPSNYRTMMQIQNNRIARERERERDIFSLICVLIMINNISFSIPYLPLSLSLFSVCISLHVFLCLSFLLCLSSLSVIPSLFVFSVCHSFSFCLSLSLVQSLPLYL